MVPRDHVYKNVASLYMASASDGCNNGKQITDAMDFDLEMGDVMGSDSRSITAVSYQTPNCPMIFKDDPDKKHRSEDSQIAWALREFFKKDDHDPQRLIFMPMAKAALFQMRAAQEFIKSKKFADLDDGWLITGASKRGWTSYMVGAAK
jgi:PhoPQ-activated pathogenicity-related protein